MSAAARIEAAAQALHADYRRARAGGKLHAPENCEGVIVCAVCERPVSLGHEEACGLRGDEGTKRRNCHACRPGLRGWSDLTEAARDDYRRTARVVASVYEPAVDRLTARAEFAEASDALLRQVLADALESGAAKLHDAGAWQQFVERVLTTPTTPGVEALREVVACARRAVRLFTPAEMVCEAGGRDVSALRAALARLDAALGGTPKEGT